MSRWRPKFDPEHLYLITTGALNLQRIFQLAVFRRLLVDALDCTRLRLGVRLYTFVVMPNHIHVIMQFKEALPLKNFVRDYKKWTPGRIIRQIKLENNRKALMLLQTTRGHSVWEEGYLAKQVYTVDFLRQKFEYIHTNSCQDHWKLSASLEEYLWSSAAFYYTDKPCIIPIDDVCGLINE